MQANIESTGTLGRRLDLSIPTAEIAAELAQRLAQLARESTMPGFRRGKVPVALIERKLGAQVQAEVLKDKLGKLLARALEQNRLRIAGRPRIEAAGNVDRAYATFRASFEVYPEIGAIDAAGLTVERALCRLGSVEIDQTIEVMRRQRSRLVSVDRPARDGDRVTVDFHGTIAGADFAGGSMRGHVFDLGAGSMLPEFEQAVRGLAAGGSTRFELRFAANYPSASVAGQLAQYELSLSAVQEQVLPELDAQFVRALGIPSGAIEDLRAEVQTNVEREVSARLRARTRDSVMEALAAACHFELPRALVEEERERLWQMAQAQVTAPGDKPPPAEAFIAAAERRVRHSLVLGEVVRRNGLQARPEQVRKAVEAIAGSYEKPAELVQWYMANPARLAEVEAVVMEDNAIDWVLQRAQVRERTVVFDELMGGTKG